jgi:hypothetical protein
MPASLVRPRVAPHVSRSSVGSVATDESAPGLALADVTDDNLHPMGRGLTVEALEDPCGVDTQWYVSEYWYR